MMDWIKSLLFGLFMRLGLLFFNAVEVEKGDEYVKSIKFYMDE